MLIETNRRTRHVFVWGVHQLTQCSLLFYCALAMEIPISELVWGGDLPAWAAALWRTELGTENTCFIELGARAGCGRWAGGGLPAGRRRVPRARVNFVWFVWRYVCRGPHSPVSYSYTRFYAV